MGRSSSSSICSGFLRSVLKLLNFFLAFVGFAVLLYAVWAMYNLDLSSLATHQHIQREVPLPESSFDFSTIHAEWFVYFLLGLGVGICLITFVGHVGAETSNGCCLSFYIFFVILLIIFQGAFAADIFLNDDWQESIPVDPTGLFDTIKSFVKQNIEFCKWAGLAIIIIEGLAVLVAACVKAVTSSSRDSYDDTDNEYDRRQMHQPLLVPGQRTDIAIPTTGIVVEGWPSPADHWGTRMQTR